MNHLFHNTLYLMWWPLRKTRQYRYVSESMNYWSNYWNKRCVDKHFTLRTTYCTLFENAIRISTLLSTILLLVGYEIQIAPWTLVFIQQTSTQNAGCHTKLSPRRGHQISAGLRTANPPTSATIIDFRGKTWRLLLYLQLIILSSIRRHHYWPPDALPHGSL